MSAPVTERPYLNFDLQIEKEPDGYCVRVLDSPAGQAECKVTLPFSDLEIENFLLKLGQRSRGTRRVESRALDGVRDFGTKLFQSTISGDVGGAYRSSLALAESEDAGLRIRLRLSAAPDLIHIPWEFLFDPVERRFIALSVDSPIVRFLDLAGATRPFDLEPPVRVLVVISSPTDFAPLQVDAEWARLKEAVRDIEARGLISLERMERPTLAELQRALRQPYHVLHFIGHGGFDEQGQDGLLVFEDDAGRGAEVSASYVSTLLRDADSLRLAVLNACDGAVSSRIDQFAGVAQSLLQQGVPAVVAMQFEITDNAAITFAHEFYGAFADGYSIEAALAEARKSIFAGQNDSEWATPVLYLRSIDGPIFKIAPATAPLPGLRSAVGAAGASVPWRPRFGRKKTAVAAALGGGVVAAVVAAFAIFGRGGDGTHAQDVPIISQPSPTTSPVESSFDSAFWANFNTLLQDAFSTGN